MTSLLLLLHQQQQQQLPIRTKLLRGRGLVAQVLPIEMQTLWYGNWQLQKPARIHTSMHWNHLRNVRCDGTSSQDNADKWTKPALLGCGREMERRERETEREREREGEGWEATEHLRPPPLFHPSPFSLSLSLSLNSYHPTVPAFVSRSCPSWFFKDQHLNSLPKKTPSHYKLQAGEEVTFPPREPLMGMSGFKKKKHTHIQQHPSRGALLGLLSSDTGTCAPLLKNVAARQICHDLHITPYIMLQCSVITMVLVCFRDQKTHLRSHRLNPPCVKAVI